MKQPQKFICNRIIDKTCKHTTDCCQHRIPHVMEEGMTCVDESHGCRFAPEDDAICVKYPVEVVTVEDPVRVEPALKPVECVPPVEPVAATTAPPATEQPVEIVAPEPTPEPQSIPDRRYKGGKRRA